MEKGAFQSTLALRASILSREFSLCVEPALLDRARGPDLVDQLAPLVDHSPEIVGVWLRDKGIIAWGVG